MINSIKNILNNDYVRMVIIISTVIYISVIDLPLSSFDKIIQSIFDSFIGQLFILLILNHYLINNDYGICLLLIVLYCFIIKIKMSNNIIIDYSETNKNEKNNLIYEKLSDLESETSITNNIEESLSDKESLQYLQESNNTEINDYINNVNHEDAGNQQYETEHIEMKGGNKKDFIKKKLSNFQKSKKAELEFKHTANLLDFEEEKQRTESEYNNLIQKIKQNKKKINKKEEKYLNILDNNVVYNDDNSEILGLKKDNKREELLKIIKRNEKLDLNKDNVLDWKDSQMQFEKWEKEMDKWMPTEKIMDDWTEMYDRMISINKKNKKINKDSKNTKSNKSKKTVGGQKKEEKYLKNLEELEKMIKYEYNEIDKV